MSETDKYYEAMDKLELVTIPDWVFNSSCADIDNGHYFPEVNLWIDAYVIALSGHRGGGKSELATALAIRSKKTWPEMRIISNFPMKWAFKENGKLVVCQSEPLDLVSMVKFEDDYQHCLIIVDESPAISNRMTAGTNKNRALNLWIQQIRKNLNSLIFCTQEFKLIDYEIQGQTDIQVSCRDAFRRYPQSGVKRGGVVLMDVLDRSGQWTGYTYDERPRVFRQRLNAEYIWGTYDTYFKIDILEQMWRLQFNKESVEVESGNAGDSIGRNDIEDMFNSAESYLRSMVAKGQNSVKCEDVYSAIGANNHSKRNAIGKWLGSLGHKRTRLPGLNDWHYTNLENSFNHHAA